MMIWTSYCTCVVHWTSRFEDNSASLLEITPLLIVGHFTLGSKGVQVSIEESCAIGSNIKHTPRVGTTRKSIWAIHCSPGNLHGVSFSTFLHSILHILVCSPTIHAPPSTLTLLLLLDTEPTRGIEQSRMEEYIFQWLSSNGMNAQYTVYIQIRYSCQANFHRLSFYSLNRNAQSSLSQQDLGKSLRWSRDVLVGFSKKDPFSS
jgi:hypothetical protein